MPRENFNLTAPPGFRGLDPNLPIRVYHRHLPHWRQSGATYFVTFRLADSIPQQQLRCLQRWRAIWEKSHPEPRSESDWRELVREITSRTEAYLDRGYGACVFRDPAIAGELQRALLHFHQQRWFTACLVVMSNHVHAVIRPLAQYELEDATASIKKFVSRAVNTRLGRAGNLWAEESYDQIVRDEEHLFHVVQYIGRNPSMAGVPRENWLRWIEPSWALAGWEFFDQS